MLSDKEKEEAWSETEIRFRADLLILNSEFPTYRKTEAMEELLEIYNKQSKEIEELKKQNKRYKKYLKNKDEKFAKVLEYVETEKEKEYTHNDKIKAKIEEVEQWELYNMKIPRLSTLDERLGAKIGIKYVLQSLLEKE